MYLSSALNLTKGGRRVAAAAAALFVAAMGLGPQPVDAQNRTLLRTAQGEPAPQTAPQQTPTPLPPAPGRPGASSPAWPAQPPQAAGNPGVGNGALPPPPRELSPAEVSALQSAMTDRSGSAILTPGNVGMIRNRVIDAQGAANAPGYSDEAPPRVKPKLMSVQPQVDASVPQTVHLAFGMVTPITILDSQGKPWPISASAYDPRMFAVDGGGCGGQAVPPAERPTTIHIMPCRVSTYGNISITLENYPLPIVLIVKSGGRGVESVDLPVTIEVRGRSPSPASAAPRTTADAEAPGAILPGAAPVIPRGLIEQAPVGARHTALEAGAAAAPAAEIRYIALPRQAASRARRQRAAERLAGGFEPDRLMDDFGIGPAPRAAQRLAVDDPAVEAWSLGGRLYLRGPVIVVNPVQDAMAQAPDGRRVYRFDRHVPRLLVTDGEGRERAVNVAY